MEITALIPAFNEGRRIASALDLVVRTLEGLQVSFEVLCVDDGSTDDTAARVEAAAAADPRIRLLRLPRNGGKGAAVRAGVFDARGAVLFVLDADLSAPPALIGESLPHLRNGTDVVVGSRTCEGARVARRQGPVRRVLGRCFLGLARRIADPAATDITCGFKGFRREAARSIFGRARVDGWAFDAETALIVRRLGLARREVPVTWTNDPDSRVRVARAALRSLLDLGRIAWYDARGRYGPDPEDEDANP